MAWRGMPGSRATISAYLAVVLIWGSSWAAIRIAVDQLPPMRVAAIRFVASGVLMLALAALRGMPMPRGRALRWSLGLGVGMVGVQYALVFSADRYISSGLTAILYATSPVIIGLITPRILGGVVPRSAFFAMLLACGGLVTILSSILSTSITQLVPAVTMLAAVAVSAVGSVYLRREQSGVPAFVTAGIQFLSGGILLALLSATLERHARAVWTRDEVLALLFLILVSSMVAFTLYYWLLSRADPFRVSTVQYLIPVAAVVEGAVLLRERIPFMSLVGGALVLGSTWLILRVPRNDDDYLSVTSGNQLE